MVSSPWGVATFAASEAIALLKRRDGLGQILVRGEKIQQSDHLESLYDKFRRFKQLDRPADLLGRCQAANHHTNRSGVDHRHFLEVKNDLAVGLTQ